MDRRRTKNKQVSEKPCYLSVSTCTQLTPSLHKEINETWNSSKRQGEPQGKFWVKMLKACSESSDDDDDDDFIFYF